jgi:hypothetical protein
MSERTIELSPEASRALAMLAERRQSEPEELVNWLICRELHQERFHRQYSVLPEDAPRARPDPNAVGPRLRALLTEFLADGGTLLTWDEVADEAAALKDPAGAEAVWEAAAHREG